MNERFATLWARLAGEFLEESFEPEYNSLEHGMRARVGGFSIAIGQEKTYGEPAPREDMRPLGGSEYGSGF